MQGFGGDNTPYIKPERRKELDPLLQKLWNELVDSRTVECAGLKAKAGVPVRKTLDEMKGEVNYCFTKILVTMLERFGARYHNLSNIKAIPDDVKEEFVRQFMHPYEDQKKEENGEVLPLNV